MSTWQTLGLVFLILFVSPIVSYLVIKFGTAGYLKAKQRAAEKKNRYE